ncbi:MAG: cistern family PEP-CTERM protein [Sphingomonadaceae bacterium]
MIRALCLSLPLLAATPAAAVLSFAPGDTVTLAFDGRSDAYLGGSTPVPGLGASLTLVFTGFTGNIARFDYSLANLSAAPMTGARVSGFGFDVGGAFRLSGSTASGAFNRTGSGNIPGFGPVDFCVRAGGSGGQCAGGGSGGVGLGALPGTGSFGLAFSSAPALVSLDNFVLRYQSLDSPELGMQGASGIGLPTTTGIIPEPKTWMMLIIGFGLVGLSLRRQQREQAQASSAT